MLTGVIQDLWHAPLIVMSYEYGDRLPAATGIALFTYLRAGFGTLLSWSRVHSGNILLAVVTYGASNAFASLSAMLVTPGDGLDPALVGLIGQPTVVLFGFLAVLLLSSSWTGRTGTVQGVPS